MLPAFTANPPPAKAMLGPKRERRTVVQAIPPCDEPQRSSYRVHSGSANGSSHRTSANSPNQTATASATIPIERRATEPRPPAVSSFEACPTPAGRVRRNRMYPAGVRQPFTGAVILEADLGVVGVESHQDKDGPRDHLFFLATSAAPPGFDLDLHRGSTDFKHLCIAETTEVLWAGAKCWYADKPRHRHETHIEDG
jgi:hypothetical protein